jgi:curved DNA-binding protein CbpA
MGNVKPTAAGNLRATPLAHLLVYLLDRCLTGTIVIERPDGSKSAVQFDSGVPVKAKTAEPVIYLGDLLLELDAIDEPTLRRTLARATDEKRLHGQILLADRAIDQDTLFAALAEQVVRKVAWMFTLPADSVYGFYQDQGLLERWGGREYPPVAPLAVIWRGIRNHVEMDRVEATLVQLGPGPFKLHRDARVGRFRFTGHEQAVADVLRAKPETLAGLLGGGLGSDELVKRVVYALAIARHLELGAPGAKPVGCEGQTARPPRPAATVGPAVTAGSGSFASVPQTAGASAAPAAVRGAGAGSTARAPTGGVQVSAATRQRIDQMKRHAEALANKNYYEILEVDPTASKPAIQSAFFQLAKTWHPDRLADELHEIHNLVTRTFARMSEAHQVLSDDEQRQDYDRVLKEGGGSAAEQEHVQNVLRAVSHFQRAEVLFKKGNFAAALTEAKAATEADPEQADYIAFHVWLLAHTPQREASGDYQDLIKTLTSVIKQHPEHESARLYRGQLLKRMGQDGQAALDFRAVAEKNPKNLEAAREVRLYRMRKGDDASSVRPLRPGGGGASLLGRLFKR